MKITQVAPAEERVPPKKYGGTERIVYGIAEELIKRGHEHNLIASGDSITSGKLYPTTKKMIRDAFPSTEQELLRAARWNSNLNAIKYLKEIESDIVHNHIGWPILAAASLFNKPVVTTLHGEQNHYRRTVLGWFKDMPFVSISDSQRKNAPDLNYIATVYNGIPIEEFEFNPKPDQYIAFIGRTSPEKGLKEAIEFSKMIGVKLKIAAKIEPLSIDYYNGLKDQIDGKQIEYVGEIAGKEKSDFLKNALALTMFISWDEPFGLVMAEAMACGTPVIGFDKGSVREVIEDKVTGFIVKDLTEASKIWPNILRLDRLNCRKRVENNFTIEKMVDGYINVYEKAISAHQSSPRTER